MADGKTLESGSWAHNGVSSNGTSKVNFTKIKCHFFIYIYIYIENIVSLCKLVEWLRRCFGCSGF
jgi:hypothetical protein